jgi:hypothetical protein
MCLRVYGVRNVHHSGLASKAAGTMNRRRAGCACRPGFSRVFGEGCMEKEPPNTPDKREVGLLESRLEGIPAEFCDRRRRECRSRLTLSRHITYIANRLRPEVYASHPAHHSAKLSLVQERSRMAGRVVRYGDPLARRREPATDDCPNCHCGSCHRRLRNGWLFRHVPPASIPSSPWTREWSGALSAEPSGVVRQIL